jgi:hypothetical protein
VSVFGSEVAEVVGASACCVDNVAHVPPLPGLHGSATVDAWYEVSGCYAWAEDCAHLPTGLEVLGCLVVRGHAATGR